VKKDIVQYAESLLKEKRFQDSPLYTEYAALLKSHKKALRRSETLVRLGDKQQRQLMHLNDKIQEKHDRLESMYEQLLLSEKMAALGRLVAGVAHEMNTPIGIGVTASSHLSHQTQVFLEDYKNNRITRTALERYTGIAQEASDLILSNLRFAASLVRNFKQVAVDQSSEKARVFKLKEYMEQVLSRLKPNLQEGEHKVEIRGDDECELDSYPGAFAQILTNLIMNSIVHGYDEDVSGNFELDIQNRGSNVCLTYKDDGKGIPSENLKKIFEAFFTTKPGQGGTGLGLHIVYNLVTQRLGGSITCQSEPDNGAVFEILIPLEREEPQQTEEGSLPQAKE